MWLKYLLDRVFALFLIIALSPVLLTIALLIKIDGFFNKQNSGSIFYSEERISAGKPFLILKFRTVTEEAVRRIRKSAGQESITSCRDTTHAGKLILKWYLDELPQVFNILKGEMSFVGPRPHVLVHHERDISKGLLYRNILKAGLLGVPQACKHHPKYEKLLNDMAENHQSESDELNTLDGLYARECVRLSFIGILFFDFLLIVRGIAVVLRGESKANL